MRVGVTGHQHLMDQKVWEWVQTQVDLILEELPQPLVGVTSLAVGADQLFARAIHKHGGTVYAVIPFAGYEARFSEPVEREAYLNLLDEAEAVEVMPRLRTDEDSYLAAGKRVVDLSDLLVALWDGLPARGTGGTAEIVEYCKREGTRLVHIDPVLMKVTWLK